jgi:rhomboid protease GluP
LSAPSLPSDSRVFQVRYGPEKPARFNDPWPNNLDLSGAGQVIISAGSVTFTGGQTSGNANRRTIAMDDIANVEFPEGGNVIVVRTRADDREVYLWMASSDDARALLEILPKATTPEFLSRQQQHRKFRENLKAIAPSAPVTPAIIGINVALFLVMLVAGAGLMGGDGRVQLAFGSNFGPYTWNGQEWRVLTAAFIHFGVIHLGFNMYALYDGGSWTERLYGSWRFAVIYLLSALAGNVASGWWDATRNSAGASGAVFGVYGALLAFFARRPGDIPMDLLKSVAGGAASLLVYSLAMGAALDFIDNSAHVGGLLAGAAAGYLLARPFEPAARAVARPWQVAAVFAGVGGVLALLAASIGT